MRSLFTLLVLVCAAPSCADVPLSAYDPVSYAQLTGLKAEATLLVEGFDHKPVAENEGRIEATTLHFRQVYEYEKGKGPTNAETIEGVEKVTGLFTDVVQEYRDGGPGALGPRYFREAAIVLGQAFDAVIRIESLKNPARRE